MVENSDKMIETVNSIIYQKSKVYQKEYHYDFRKVQAKCLSDYFRLIKELDTDLEITNDVKRICDKLRGIITSSYSGRRSTAYSKLKNLMNVFEKDNGLLCSFDHNCFLYRMRVCDLRRNIERKDLFHIPFSQIRNVKTQRYSAPGYPCLYLAKSVYSCWEEMHRPSVDTALVSIFKAKSGFNLIDLRIPDKDHYENYKDFYIKFFPIIIICTIPVVYTDCVFKPEYIIPQFILEWIIEKGKDFNCMGITYTSTFKTDEFFSLDFEWENIVIPVQDINYQSEYCPILSELFELSKPTCCEFERMQGTFNHDGYWYNGPKRLAGDDKNKEYKKNYYYSIFSLLEEELETRGLKGINNK
jgi:hypothetical protein